MFCWEEYDKVNEMVNDPHEELCNEDARAEYLFDVYDALHDTSFDKAVENDAVDWGSINRIDCLIIDRLIELGRMDDWSDGEIAVRCIDCFDTRDNMRYVYSHGGIECYVSMVHYNMWTATEFVIGDDDRISMTFAGRGVTAQDALSNMRLVVPVRGNFHVKFCLNGDTDNVVMEESFDNESEYTAYVESLPYDFIDADATTHWVDYGDE